MLPASFYKMEQWVSREKMLFSLHSSWGEEFDDTDHVLVPRSIFGSVTF